MSQSNLNAEYIPFDVETIPVFQDGNLENAAEDSRCDLSSANIPLPAVGSVEQKNGAMGGSGKSFLQVMKILENDPKRKELERSMKIGVSAVEKEPKSKPTPIEPSNYFKKIMTFLKNDPERVQLVMWLSYNRNPEAWRTKFGMR